MAVFTQAHPQQSSANVISHVERYIANPPETSVVLTFTPEMAGAILATYNAENRGLKPHKIRPLIGDLRSGEWMLTGETIKFSKRRLLDGQNRLTACMESGVPIKTHVVFGIDDNAFAIIDTGAPRTAGDVLVCAGIANPQMVAHVVSRLYAWEETPGVRSILRLSPNQVLHLYQTRYSDIGEHIAWGRELQAKTRLAASRGIALHYAFTKAAGQKVADTFVRAWIDNDPTIQQASLLHRRLAQLQSMLSGSLRANTVYAMAIKAFNHFMVGRPIDVGQIAWKEGEPMPSIRSVKDE